MAAAMVAEPTPTTAATRTPPAIDGSASGSSTRRRSSPGVMPMATPASRIDASMLVSPVIVERTIGSSPYRISTTMAARAPMPPTSGTGRRKPNIARLGIVCTMFASPTIGVLRRGRLAAKMPRGMPIATAASVDTATSVTCCASSATNSARCDIQKASSRVIVSPAVSPYCSEVRGRGRRRTPRAPAAYRTRSGGPRRGRRCDPQARRPRACRASQS